MESTGDMAAETELAASVGGPVLVVLPDPETRVRMGRAVLGRTPPVRLAQEALAHGFEAVYMAAGTGSVPEGADEIATGEPVGKAALVVFETVAIHPRLLGLMVQHPLEPDEGFSVYDEAGRPVAWFAGQLDAVPSIMPISEELELPADMGPADVARLVYAEDRDRMESLVLRSERIFETGTSWWHRNVSLPILRWLANGRRPLEQIEVLALIAAVASGPLVLLGSALGLTSAGLCLLLGVEVSKELRRARWLRSGRAEPPGPDAPGESLSRATRSLGHAAAIVGLTYVLVAESDRTSVAGLVLLAAGAAAALLSLGQARRLLRGDPAEPFALPDVHVLARRLGLRPPGAFVGAPLLEIAVLATGVWGRAELPWSVLAAAGLARLWRWFVAGQPGPPRL